MFERFKIFRLFIKNLKFILIKIFFFINQDLVGFEPTGKCPIDVLVKTIKTPQLFSLINI